MEQNTCNKCGRPMNYATKTKCNYCDACMSEHCGCKLGRIKEMEPTCDSTAVIPSITVESVEGITNLANCLVHVEDINTTFYVDDKHRIMITWAGPVDIPGYDMKNNPNGYRDQIVTDIENETAVIYDKHGNGFLFGITKDNLQTAINNKLDEMAENGDLETVIATYVEDVVHGFDTVADMKASTDLTDGKYAKTLGYYTKNDLGEATYKIRLKGAGETPDEMTLIALQDNTLVAELMLSEEMNVRQFGAKGDGVADDTASIQAALDNSPTTLIPTGTYMVNALANDYPYGALIVNTGNKVILDKEAKIKMIANSLRTYRIFLIDSVSSVEISGGILEGDRDSHTGSDGEWGHCIAISGSADDIFIHDIYLKDAWGDGISFGGSGTVRTTNVHVDNVRRNGYSVINAGLLISTNDLIENVGGDTGTAPKDGVDVEPDTNAQSVNATFNNLTTRNNTHIGFQLYHPRNNTIPMYIELNNFHSDGDSTGLLIEYGPDAKGTVIVNNPVVKNTTSTIGGIRVVPTGMGYNVNISNPVIEGYRVTSISHNGLVIAGHTDSVSGNIAVLNPTVIKPNADAGVVNNSAIRFEGFSGSSYDNIKIINPLDLGGKIITTNGAYTNTIIRDDFNCSKIDQNSALNIGSGIYYSLVTSSSYTANRTVTVKSTSTIPTGSRIKFMNTGSYKMNIVFEDQYIYPLSSVTGSTVTLNDKGDMIEIERLSSTEWSIINDVGNVTVA